MALVWMSGPPEAVAKGGYTHGPVPWYLLTPDEGDVVVGKNRRGEVVVAELNDKPYKGKVL